MQGQVKILNYRDTTINELLDNQRFIGDCIECAVQQYNAFQVLNNTADENLLPAVVYTKNNRGWNHFMFGILSTTAVDGVRGIVFDNENNNQLIVIREGSAVITMNGTESHIVSIFHHLNESWMIGSDDIYSTKPDVNGWDISQAPFTSKMGLTTDFVLDTDPQQLLLEVRNLPPFVDIVLAESGISVLDAFPESEIAKLVSKLQSNS